MTETEGALCSISLDDISNEEAEQQYFDDEEDDELVYHNFYNCMPPPIFMFCITMAEVCSNFS